MHVDLVKRKCKPYNRLSCCGSLSCSSQYFT